MFRSNKKNKKQPRRLPTDNARELQIELDRRIGRFAQVSFAKYYYKNYKKALLENDAGGCLYLKLILHCSNLKL